jgi:16S rRNA (adenine1518-N6/adenine1519-N6)-dimethyltransferase
VNTKRITDLSVIKDLCIEAGFTFSKAKGQNFLINPSVCPRIAEAGIPSSGKTGVIEIGTGLGVLTKELCKKASKVVAIEIDKRLMPILEQTLSEYTNFKVINDDFLNIDLKNLLKEEFDGFGSVSVCANLPYYITSPVLMKIIESNIKIDQITVMVQREAALRLCAKIPSRECGAVTYAVRYAYMPEILFNVSRGSFFPSPNVESSVIRLTKIDNKRSSLNRKDFFKVVKAAFSQRRKTLLNSLSSGLSMVKDRVAATLSLCGIGLNTRPEELTFEQMELIAENIFEQDSIAKSGVHNIR